MPQEYIFIQPEYVSKFQCDGSLCDDLCCSRDWYIDIDQKTYQKYQRLNNKNFKNKILSAIKFNKKKKNYEIKLEHHQCPLLQSDNLCSIHRQLGEDYLSITCATYPRFINEINGYLVQSLYMSCPLAARIALLNKEAMAFEKISSAKQGHVMLALDTERLASSDPLFRYMTDIQMFIITILQNRDFTIEDRLTIIGLFLIKADELQEKNESSQMPALIESYNELIASNEFDALLTSIKGQPNERIKFQFHLIDHLCQDGISAVLKQYTDLLISTLNLSSENNETSMLLKAYQSNDELYYSPFIKKHEYILENYLINDFFQLLFPFTLKTSITKNYILFVSFFAMLKFLSVGLVAHHKENMSEEHLIKLISKFSRVKASAEYILRLNKDLEKEKYDVLHIIKMVLK